MTRPIAIIAAAALLLAACSKPPQDCASANAPPVATPPDAGPRPKDDPKLYVWPQQVKTREELWRCGMLGAEWTELTHEGMQLAFAIEDWPTSGESYIDVYAYVYNRSFEEWRQFFAVKLRGAGFAVLRYDEDAGTVSVLGAANNDLDGVALFTFDLAAVYDDRAYVR